jgi:hypothetical protein
MLAAALKRNPRDTDALVQRADLAVGAGNFKEAEQDLKTVLHLAPPPSSLSRGGSPPRPARRCRSGRN